jgi:hypothetical protein
VRLAFYIQVRLAFYGGAVAGLFAAYLPSLAHSLRIAGGKVIVA